MHILLLLAALLAPVQAYAAELIMFEQKGCVWCQRFDSQVGALYDKTTEGQRAPLRRVDIGKPQPQDLAFIRRERFTPVFVLVDNGREFGRIRGYPGDTFFWGLLAGMVEKLDRGESAAPEPLGAAPPGATFAE
jgi:thioredoxin-related protein